MSRFSTILDRLRAVWRVPKTWQLPRRAAIAVMHGSDSAVLVPLFGGHTYEVVPVDGETFYVHPQMLARTLRYFVVTRRLALAHALAVLDAIKPAIVVTFIDNSAVFQMCGERYTAARFLAVQNGTRALDRDNPPGSRRIRLCEFACLGRYEVEQYASHGASVGEYYPVGSLRDSYYRARRAVDAAPAKEFDLCVPSQFKASARHLHPERLDSFEILTAHVKRFCESHGTTVCVPLRRPPGTDPEGYEWEREFFEARLGGLARIFPSVPGAYTTYSLVDRSRVSIGMHTTVLREGFGRGNRILSCNYSGKPYYTFPVPGPWTLTDPAYEIFEQRLLWLLRASDDEYRQVCGDAPSYLIGYEERMPTHVFLQALIADAVRGGAAPFRPKESNSV